MSELSYAVMQPYFLPARRYFELIDSVDYFVLFDNAQFPRRGRVHRFEALNQQDSRTWLTLPIEKTKQATEIQEIKLSPGWLDEFRSRLRGYPKLASSWVANSELTECAAPSENLFQYLRSQIMGISIELGFQSTFLNASELRARNTGESAESYIIALGRELGCGRYRNLSGGKDFYSPENFARSGIAIEFRPPSEDNGLSILTQWSPEDGWNGCR